MRTMMPEQVSMYLSAMVRYETEGTLFATAYLNATIVRSIAIATFCRFPMFSAFSQKAVDATITKRAHGSSMFQT